MLWTVVFVIALAVGQVPARPETPEYEKAYFVENIRESSDSRIVSGWEAYPGQLPHHVFLRMVNPNGLAFSCGGSLVAKNWVITAAHCTAGRASITVRAGVVNVNSPEFTREAAGWHNYPTYVDELATVVQPNDISLLELQQPVTFTKLTQPIRIQPRSDARRNYQDQRLIASGHGLTWTGGTTPQNLNWVYLVGVSNPTCAASFGTGLINDNAICARYYNVTSQSTCQGDSGGPLIEVDSEGVPTLVGVASFVAGGNFGCHSGLPAGFIRPGPFHDWFTQISGIDFENLHEEEEETEAPPTEAPTTTTEPPTTTTEAPETEQPTTTTEAPTTTPTPEESGEDSNDVSSEEGEDDDEDDPELNELLKKLQVLVKVKVKMSKYGKIKHKHEVNHNKNISSHR